jgi:hypothetical protein
MRTPARNSRGDVYDRGWPKAEPDVLLIRAALFFGMATCGASQKCMVYTTFWLPDGNGLWGFNFNPRGYPDTEPVTVVREDPVTWSVSRGGWFRRPPAVLS